MTYIQVTLIICKKTCMVDALNGMAMPSLSFNLPNKNVFLPLKHVVSFSTSLYQIVNELTLLLRYTCVKLFDTTTTAIAISYLEY